MQPQLISAGVCTWCGTRFTAKQRTQRFCSRRCAGQYQWRNHPRRPHKWGKRPPLDSEHRRMRKLLLPAALGQPCPIGCGRIMDTTAQLDHILSRALGGQTTHDNCRIICAPCNGKRGQRLGGKRAHSRTRQRTQPPPSQAPTAAAAYRSDHW